MDVGISSIDKVVPGASANSARWMARARGGMVKGGGIWSYSDGPVLSADGESLEKQARPITLQILLAYTFGAAYDLTSPAVARWQARHNGPPSEPGTPRPVEEFQPSARTDVRAPSANTCENMHARIVAPLMLRSTPSAPRVPTSSPRLANLTPADPDALGLAIMRRHVAINTRMAGDFGGHAMCMSAPDYVKVLRALLRNDGTSLEA
ncbi:Beta-lactamase-related protein [Mycena sanguinolenta]|uniref:Beta-lactamase-related protein n=1 Tax=Mycena sanguinolenta TaxID=230812 RepID=A0A8H6YB53_9AGAR|nr:Beta-lactamase-related protein [Mycena sanguinolenta]